MATSTSEADVILNRINVSLARSQRLINSWLPPKLESQDVEDNEDEEDFKSMTEIGGLGSKTAYAGYDGLPDGAFQRQKLSSNDKLLEQLLGKKAAQARKKSQEAGKSMSTSKHAAPKQLTTRPKASREVDSEDDDEGGRAAAFKSKQQKKRSEQRSADALADDEQIDGSIDVQSVAAAVDTDYRGSSNAASIDTEQKPAKRKATSYLDELLAQKANKKSKRKKSNS
jgi:hypothetical protein